jgi:hypothetical protein
VSAPEEPPAGRVSPGLLQQASRAASYALVLFLAVANAIWSVFLLPLRVSGTLVPVSLLLAGLGTAALGVAGARVLGSRAGAVAPGVVWVGLAVLAASKRPEGDLLIAGGEGSGLATLGLVFLLVGTVGAGAGYGLSRPGRPARPGVDAPERPARAASTSPEGTSGR